MINGVVLWLVVSVFQERNRALSSELGTTRQQLADTKSQLQTVTTRLSTIEQELSHKTGLIQKLEAHLLLVQGKTRPALCRTHMGISFHASH